MAGIIDNTLRSSFSVSAAGPNRSAGPTCRVVDAGSQIVPPSAPELCWSTADVSAVAEGTRASTARSAGIAAVVSNAAKKTAANALVPRADVSGRGLDRPPTTGTALRAPSRTRIMVILPPNTPNPASSGVAGGLDNAGHPPRPSATSDRLEAHFNHAPLDHCEKNRKTCPFVHQ